jgi:hypothetical protein
VAEDRHVADLVNARALTLVAGLLLLGPPLVVGAIGLGLSPALAWLVPVGAALAAWWSGRVPALPATEVRAHPVLALLWIAAFAVAVTFSIRTSLYAHFPDQTRFSVAPGDLFREEHLCMTAYAEAARFLRVPGTNVYDPELYRPNEVPRRIGRFTVDYYHYPPPFLLLPSAVRLVAPDFFDFRRVWFALQTIVMMALWPAVAWWVGGSTGRRFALAGIVLVALPVTWASIQVGNVQTTIVAVALAGLMAAASRREAAGAVLLTAATLGKIFPGLLLAHVLTWWRPGFAAWSAAAAVGFVAVTATIFGVGIFHSFLFGELPRMLSGASFSQTELPWTSAVNQSIYGFTVKLRTLGVDVLDRDTGKAVTRAIVVLIGLATVVVGARIVRPAAVKTSAERLGVLVIGFAFLNAASLISPFVGGAYGAVYTIWLGGLLAVADIPRTVRLAVFAATCALVILNALAGSPRPGVVPTAATMLMATTGSVLLFAINVIAVWWGSRLLRGGSGPGP